MNRGPGIVPQHFLWSAPSRFVAVRMLLRLNATTIYKEALPSNFTLLINLSLQDGDFSEDRFQKIVNAALANDVGNCLNRTLGLLHKFCEGRLPEASAGSVLSQQKLR